MKPMSRFWKIFLGVLVLAVVVAGFLGPKKEIHAVWDYKGFFAVYGFIGCAVIILVSSTIGRVLVQKEEGYYREHRAPEPGVDRTGGGDV